MDSFEWNKVFGAILLAALVASLSGFVARTVVSPGHEEAAGVKVEAANVATQEDKGPEPILALLASADVEAGQKSTKVCQSCHTFEKGAPAKVGPNLYGVVGNKHAHMDGFAYSSGMAAMHDQEWTYDELNKFLYSPKAYVKGTKMAFAGLKKTQERANVIAYLRTLSDNPMPLPAAK